MLPPTGMSCNRAVLVSIDVLQHMHGQHPDKAAHMNLEQRKEGRAFKIDRGRRLCRQARVDGGRLQDWATVLITHVRADWWRKRPSMENRSCRFSRLPQPQRSASGLWHRRGRRNLARSAQASALCPAVGQVLPQANASGRLGGTPPPCRSPNPSGAARHGAGLCPRTPGPASGPSAGGGLTQGCLDHRRDRPYPRRRTGISWSCENAPAKAFVGALFQRLKGAAKPPPPFVFSGSGKEQLVETAHEGIGVLEGPLFG